MKSTSPLLSPPHRFMPRIYSLHFWTALIPLCLLFFLRASTESRYESLSDEPRRWKDRWQDRGGWSTSAGFAAEAFAFGSKGSPASSEWSGLLSMGSPARGRSPALGVGSDDRSRNKFSSSSPLFLRPADNDFRRARPHASRNSFGFCSFSGADGCWDSRPKKPCRSGLWYTISGAGGPSRIVCKSTTQQQDTDLQMNLQNREPMVATNGASTSNGAVANHGAVNGAAESSLNGSAAVEPNSESLNDGDSQGGDAWEASTSDIPLPTSNGGYTHTSASKAKISAANLGKTPWNKGKTRSAETRARIAEGVRRRNREKFLEKLKSQSITEEEYEERKKEDRRKVDAERRARKTAKGGYTPTEETKRKISKVLKSKYASGEIVRAPRNATASKSPGVRRGFKHSDETKQKIRETLRRKWAEDEEYRALMTNKTQSSVNHSNKDSIRARIAETLRKKWQDPEFRAEMMDKMSKRKSRSNTDSSHREKISASMKKKWMDDSYRKKAMEGMAKVRKKSDSGATRRVQPMATPKKKKAVTSSLKGTGVRALRPLTSGVASKGTFAGTRTNASSKMKRSRTSTGAIKKRKKRKTTTKSAPRKIDAGGEAFKAVEPLTPSSIAAKEQASAMIMEGVMIKDVPEEEGSISRMREERRDLYDLLYGDEEDRDGMGMGDGDNAFSVAKLTRGRKVGRPAARVSTQGSETPVSSQPPASLPGFGELLRKGEVDDEDLDEYDPYGLSNF